MLIGVMGFPLTRIRFSSCACGLVGGLFLSPRSSSSSSSSSSFSSSYFSHPGRRLKSAVLDWGRRFLGGGRGGRGFFLSPRAAP